MKRILLFFAGLFLVTSIASAQVLPVEDILKLKDSVNCISLPENNFNSLSFDLEMNLPLPLNLLCQVRYAASDSYSLRVFDKSDMTPVLVVADKKAMIYDPISAAVTVVKPVGAFFELVPQGNQFNANFAFNMPVEGKINNKINLDLVSLFGRVKSDLKGVKGEDGISFSGTTSQDARCEAVFETEGAKNSVKSFKLYVKDNEIPVLSFNKILFDVEVSADWFLYPEVELASSGLDITSYQDPGAFSAVIVASQVMKAIFARTAIANEPIRSEIEKMLMVSPNWEEISEKDRMNSVELRKLFKPVN